MTVSAATGFDRRAAEYEQHASLQREAAAWLAEWLPEKITGPALELGAGTGLFTRHLAARGALLTASDSSPRMVELGARTFPDITWQVADAAHPPAIPACRWIFSSSLIQWLPDPTTAFRRWREITSPRTRLLGGWFVRGTLQSLYDTCPAAAPFPWRTTDEWQSLLATAGWQATRTETRVYSRQYPDSLSMFRDIHRTGAIVPLRFGSGRLRNILRDHDRQHRPNITADYVFLRLEAMHS
jgi:malonyl-CoA O-methyltransferase